MFADDINLFFSDDCYNQLFRVANEELTYVDHWLMANQLSLNISKTNYIVSTITKVSSALLCTANPG